MTRVSKELREEAGRAFLAYEEVVVNRLLKRPGWKLDAQPLQDARSTDDEEVVRQFIESVNRGRIELLRGIVV